jgi:hypothetical protein
LVGLSGIAANSAALCLQERACFLDHEVECRDKAIAKIRADMDSAAAESELAAESLRTERDAARAEFHAHGVRG